MGNECSTIEILQNNAKAFGGVIGAEQAYLEARPETFENEFFLDLQTLNLQDVKFSDIEKTKLGTAIKNQIRKLENRVQMLIGTMTDLQNQ